MHTIASELWRRPFETAVALAAAAWGLARGFASGPISSSDLAILAVLLAGVGTISWLASRSRAPRMLHLAPAFVLVTLLLLPAPAGLLVVLLAFARDRESSPLAAPLAAVAVSRFVADLAIRPPLPRPALDPLPALALLFVTYYTIAALVRSGLSLLPGSPRTVPLREALPEVRLRAELLNVPVAWVLVAMPGLPELAAATALVVLADVLLARLARISEDLRRTNDALAARVTELATLHAVGREIVSSLDLKRVFEIVDRECRKILEIETLSIALIEPEGGRAHELYRRSRGEPPDDRERPLGDPLALAVVADKRARRIDDLGAEFPRTPRGSALAVPLVVEDRVLGILAVRTPRPSAYDDHQLAVLSTIAQQAAIAIENARHHRMATIDSLTGLHLRDYFFRRVEEEHVRARRYRGAFALLMLDVDRFKEINDRRGHLAGDRYLRALGAAIRTRLRAADLACRFGGDEVCILLPETDRAGAVAIAERLRVALGHLRSSLDDPPFSATVSVGVAAYPEDEGGGLDVLLRRADQALYRAKRGGRDRVEAWRPGSAKLTRRARPARVVP